MGKSDKVFYIVPSMTMTESAFSDGMRLCQKVKLSKGAMMLFLLMVETTLADRRLPTTATTLPSRTSNLVLAKVL